MQVVLLSPYLLCEINEWKLDKAGKDCRVHKGHRTGYRMLTCLEHFVFCSLLSCTQYFCVQWQILLVYMSRFFSHSCSEILPFWIWKVKAPGSHLNRPSSTISLLHHGSIIRGPGISLASDSLICRFRVPYLFEVPLDEPRWLRRFRVHMGISSLSFAESFIWTVTMKTCLRLEHGLNGWNICAFSRCVCAQNCNMRFFFWLSVNYETNSTVHALYGAADSALAGRWSVYLVVMKPENLFPLLSLYVVRATELIPKIIPNGALLVHQTPIGTYSAFLLPRLLVAFLVT